MQSYCKAISINEIYPESFKNTNSNPNSTTLKQMFDRFGIEDCYKGIFLIYKDKKGRTLNKNLIKNTLDNFVKRRHEAAHHGRVSNMTRTDVEDDHIFIVELARSVNSVIDNHLISIK